MTEPRDWQRHVIVCGLDGVGLRAVEQLHQEGVGVVVVESRADPRRTQTVQSLGVPVIVGSSQFADTLWAAGLAGAAAVMCVEAGDLNTLETALLARELRADVRVVVRLANQAVGKAVTTVTGAGSVLDVAGLAAPAVVEACLSRHIHTFDIADQLFMTAETDAPQDGSLRSLFGNLAPVAVLRAGGVEVCPGRDMLVSAGERVTLLGTAAELAAAGIGVPVALEPPTVRAQGVRTARRIALGVLRGTDRPLRIVLGILLGLLIITSIVLRFTFKDPGHPDLPFIQSVYFTVETIATVGFGDFSFANQSPWLLAFGIFLIIAGTALVTTTFALLTNLLVSRRVGSSLGRERALGMRDHVVIIGLGAVGLRVMDQLLAEGVEVVIVERDEDNRFLTHAKARKVPVVIANSTVRETLDGVRVSVARAVAVLTSDDLTNIETALAVREVLGDRWNEVPVVLRVFDRQLARTVEQSFGFSHVRSTSASAAPWFVGAALGLTLLETFDVGTTSFLVGMLTVTAGGGLDGLAMQDLSARTRVIALDRGGQLEHPPRRDSRFAAGDQAYLLGPYEELLTVLRQAGG